MVTDGRGQVAGAPPGPCTHCGAALALPGRKRCAECTEYFREKQREYAARKASTYHYRLAEGLCPKCGAVPGLDKKMCSQCLANARASGQAELNRERYADRRAVRACTYCGKPLDTLKTKMCTSCRAEATQRLQQLWNDGRIWWPTGLRWVPAWRTVKRIRTIGARLGAARRRLNGKS